MNNVKSCSPHCLYFPQMADEISEEYVDENGVKFRKVVRKCRFDGHEITAWDKCENMEEIKNEFWVK